MEPIGRITTKVEDQENITITRDEFINNGVMIRWSNSCMRSKMMNNMLAGQRNGAFASDKMAE